MAITSKDIPIEAAMAEWAALSPEERHEVVSTVFRTASQTAEDRLLRARVGDVAAWNAFLSDQRTFGQARLLPLLEARLREPLSETDQEFLSSVARNNQPDLLQCLLERLVNQADAEEGNAIARALVEYVSYDARPTYNALLTRDEMSDPAAEALSRVDRHFCAQATRMIDFLATRFDALPANQVDAILEAITLSRSVSVLPATIQALISTDARIERGTERKAASQARLRMLCKMEPSQAVIALPCLLAEHLPQETITSRKPDPLERTDPDLMAILIRLQRETAYLTNLPPDHAQTYLQRLTTIAAQVEPPSLRLELAAAIWNAARAFSPAHAMKTLQAFLRALEDLEPLRYDSGDDTSAIDATADARLVIDRIRTRLQNLIAIKNKQGI